MAEVTVAELADEVKTSAERLLAQMSAAGLPHKSADETVSEEQKRELLKHLEQAHGGPSDAGPKKITLNRTKVTRLRAGAGRKTVAVVAKKKRTYVKRGAEAAEPEVAAPAAAAAPASAPETAEPETDVHRAAELAAEEARLATLAVEAAEAEAREQEVAAAAEQAAADAAASAEAAAAAAAAETADDSAAEPAEAVADAAPAAEAKPVEGKITGKKIVRRRVASGLAAERERFRQEEQARVDALARARQEDVDRKQRVADEIDRKKREAEKKQQEAEAAKARAAKAAVAPPPPPPADAENAKPGAGKRGDDRRGNKGRDRGGRGRDDGDGRGRRREGTLSRLDGRARRRSRHQRSDVPRGQHGFQAPTETIVRDVEVPEAITVGDLAQRMSVKAGEVIKALMGMGVMANINQMLDQDTATLLVEEMGHKVITVSATALEDALVESVRSVTDGDQVVRPPVVTVMGHVDHGKTSLLDYIRKAKVASGEAGGITQHIGAYHVPLENGGVTFVDTPGHAAFTAMRARGAKVTDVVILVVAADDGVMPQTEEAVQHAKAAGVPIVVAVNKCDKEGADPDRVRNELSAKDVIPEAWGGDVPFINVSAHTGDGIDDLLEAVMLQAELLELRAVPDAPASGVVIESKLERGRGPVATILVQNGTLRRGDIVIAGEQYGRVRAMVGDSGDQPTEVGPAMPVEILGLDGTPGAGDEFLVVADERKAREVAEFRESRSTEHRLAAQQASKLENMFANLKDGEKRIMNVVLKTDVRGTLEAITAAVADLSNDEVGVNLVGSGVGGITESDTNLAVTSGAQLIGFNVRADSAAKKVIEREALDLRYYSVIYELLDDIKVVLEGMLAPEVREEIVGVAEVREVFRSPKFGDIAGSLVLEGTVHKAKPIRVLREDVVIYEGELESLRRFKDDVSEVKFGLECGIGVKNYKDVRPGDRIEVFERKEFAREL